MRAKRLADGSTRDTEWQRKEYERLMGHEAAERQEFEARKEAKACVCRHKTVRAKGRTGYRTIHERHCIKYKEWMEEYLQPLDGALSAEAHSRAMHDESKV
jgi:hypothetical protein